jgi:hypothetical protein
MVFAAVGLPADGALAFALLRRARQIAWVAAGLALFPGHHLSLVPSFAPERHP